MNSGAPNPSACVSPESEYDNVSIFNCCLINHPKSLWRKTIIISLAPDPEDQKSWQDSLGTLLSASRNPFFFLVASLCMDGLGSLHSKYVSHRGESKSFLEKPLKFQNVSSAAFFQPKQITGPT